MLISKFLAVEANTSLRMDEVHAAEMLASRMIAATALHQAAPDGGRASRIDDTARGFMVMLRAYGQLQAALAWVRRSRRCGDACTDGVQARQASEVDRACGGEDGAGGWCATARLGLESRVRRRRSRRDDRDRRVREGSLRAWESTVRRPVCRESFTGPGADPTG